MGELPRDLGRGAELIETHISWVFLRDGNVLKVKKPVDYGFLDFRSLERRKAACEDEVRLNQRLTRDVYLGVVPITRDEAGEHAVAGHGEIVDYAVSMRRLSEGGRADERLRAGTLGRGQVQRIAQRIAAFHAGARRGPEIDRAGHPAAIEINVRENFAQAGMLALDYITPTQERELEANQLGFLERNAALFEARIRDGRIRDGHGDLRLEHVYLEDDDLQIIDCIEFNERFRHGDVCADIAFLTMDLCHEGHPQLADDLLAAYARASGDYGMYELIDFYQAYRATVRAKVSSFLACAEGTNPVVRARAAHSARGFFLQALLAQRKADTAPCLVGVAGLIASGKSRTSERVAALLHCALIDTDGTRKQLLGLSEQTPRHEAAFSGVYTPESSAQVYAEVLRRASFVLSSGRSVVVDASFRTTEHRTALLELAKRTGANCRVIECWAPREVVMDRLARRAEQPNVSDGRVEIYDAFAASWQPLDELPPTLVRRIDTTQSDAAIEAAIEAHLAPFAALPQH